MESLPPFVLDLTVLFIVASAVAVMFQKIRQPVVIGYILAGIIIGPHTSGFCVHDVKQVYVLSELGVIFLMFSIGLEFSFRRLKSIGLPAIITAMIKSSCLVTLGFYLGRWLGWGRYSSLFFGAALAFSSTTIIFKVLEDFNLRRKKFAELVCGILIVEDLLAVLMLTALTTVVETHNIFSFGIVLAGLKLLLVIGSWFFIGYYLTPVIFRRIIHYVTAETITLVSITLCLSLSIVFAYFRYSTALGAFIMGSILADTPHLAHRIKNLINPLRDVFAAIFFVSVGMGIDLLGLGHQWQLIIFTSLLLTLVSITITSIGSFLTGNDWRDGIRVGFSMVPIGEFSFIILALGVSLKITDGRLYQTIVGIATLTTLITPYLIQCSNNLVGFLELKLPEKFKLAAGEYSKKIYQFLAHQEKAVYRQLLMKYLINILAISAVFLSIKFLIIPNLLSLFPSSNLTTLGWVLAILVISPFIWNLLTNYYFLPVNGQTFAKIVGFLLTLITLIVFSIALFKVWYVALGVAFGIVLTCWYFKRPLSRILRWTEKKLNTEILDQPKKFDPLELIDTPLAEVKVDHDELTGKTLASLSFREKHGLEIVSVQRNNRVFDKPRGNFVLKNGDLLTLLGKKEQLKVFRESMAKDVALLHNPEYLLQMILLDEKSDLINCKISDLHFKEKLKGHIVGIERRGIKLLNPDSATLLKEGDILLVVDANK